MCDCCLWVLQLTRWSPHLSCLGSDPELVSFSCLVGWFFYHVWVRIKKLKCVSLFWTMVYVMCEGRKDGIIWFVCCYLVLSLFLSRTLWVSVTQLCLHLLQGLGRDDRSDQRVVGRMRKGSGGLTSRRRGGGGGGRGGWSYAHSLQSYLLSLMLCLCDRLIVQLDQTYLCL